MPHGMDEQTSAAGSARVTGRQPLLGVHEIRGEPEPR